jgi:hypothetical protein
MMSSDLGSDPGQVDIVYVVANMAHYASWFELPSCPTGYQWQLCFNTGDLERPVHLTPSEFEHPGLLVGERSVVILQASPSG